MRFIHFVYTCVWLCFLFSNCKKKASIEVKVYNARLDEFVPGATVILYEDNFGLNFGPTTTDIKSAVTDGSGRAYFENVKLKTSHKHNYNVTLKEAWGISNPSIYQMESGESYLNKGNTKITLDDNDPNASFTVKCNNVFNPSQLNDNITILITSVILPRFGHSGYYTIGGDTVFKKSMVYDPANLPYPNTINSNSINYKASRLIISIKKTKMGVYFSAVDTIKIYPNINNYINIDW